MEPSGWQDLRRSWFPVDDGAEQGLMHLKHQ